jgi:hypothetical protein
MNGSPPTRHRRVFDNNLATGHFCLWKLGIRHGDVSLGNMMWDDRLKVGVLNDFDLAKFENQEGPIGHDNTGTLPFMALDLVSDKGLHGRITRLYRHDAEAFAWSLIYLCLVTVEDEDGENYTLSDPNPLAGWFGEWIDSFHAKIGLQWHHHDDPGIPFAYPNTKDLAITLHEYWVDRYKKQFPRASRVAGKTAFTARLFNVPAKAEAKGDTPYEELGDDQVFQELLVQSELGLQGQNSKAEELVKEMSEKYSEIDWNALAMLS